MIIMDMVLMELVHWKITLHMIRMSIMHRCKWDYLHYIIRKRKSSTSRNAHRTRLLHTVELHLQEQGKTVAHVHLCGMEYFESHSFCPKHGYIEYAPSMMKKKL